MTATATAPAPPAKATKTLKRPLRQAVKIPFGHYPPNFRKVLATQIKNLTGTKPTAKAAFWTIYIEGAYAQDEATGQALPPGLTLTYNVPAEKINNDLSLREIGENPDTYTMALEFARIDTLATFPNAPDTHQKLYEPSEWAWMEWICQKAAGLSVGVNPGKPPKQPRTPKEKPKRWFAGHFVEVGRTHKGTTTITYQGGDHNGAISKVDPKYLADDKDASVALDPPMPDVTRPKVKTSAVPVPQARFGQVVHQVLHPSGNSLFQDDDEG